MARAIGVKCPVDQWGTECWTIKQVRNTNHITAMNSELNTQARQQLFGQDRQLSKSEFGDDGRLNSVVMKLGIYASPVENVDDHT